MSNGFYVGNRTIFNSPFIPINNLVLRYPDGRIFEAPRPSLRFWNDKAFAGHSVKTPDGKYHAFLYSDEAGLILKGEDQEKYDFYFDKFISGENNLIDNPSPSKSVSFYWFFYNAPERGAELMPLCIGHLK